jgi:N-acetylglutamate synthase-like GNAT family acetyltransferase
MTPDLKARERAAPPPFTIRRAHPNDAAPLSRLLAQSYARLLAKDYAPDLLAEALPRISRAQPELLSAPGYLVAEAGGGEIVAAGGWTWRGPAGGAAPLDWGHVRHVAVHPDMAGAGLGRLILMQAVDQARESGARVLACFSTLTARGFYARMGFADLGEVELSLAPGIGFPAVQMRKVL